MVVGRHRRWWGLLLCGLLLGCTMAPAGEPAASGAPSPSPAWRSATPESQGFDSALLADAVRSLDDRDLAIHALVLVRGGAVVLDAAFYPYDGATPHQVGSITKSVVTTLLGIAVDRGSVTLDDPVVSFFPGRTIANRDARKERMTLRHLASMTAGLACSAGNDEATLREMLASPDWVGFTLDLPVTAEPGTVFHYCSPAMHLLSAVLQEATGVTTLDLARQFLFEPLGISDVRWATDPQGYQRGWSDLYLLPRDLARFGELWQRDGSWDGRRIVSEDWIAAAGDAQVVTGGSLDYGFGWWIPRLGDPGVLQAEGHGGQMLLIRPDLGLVMVTAGCGMDPAPVVGPLVETLVSPGAPLISDPLGESSLAKAVAAVGAGPRERGLTSPKATVKAVSGRTYRLDANPLGLTSIRLDLKGKTRQGSMRLTYADNALDEVLPVGLDGRYRTGLDRHRRPVAARAEWVEGRTLALDIDEVAGGRAATLRLQFSKDGDSVTVEGLERGHATGFVIAGVASD